MRVLRCAWPIAGVLLVSLASAGTAWGEGNPPAPELRPSASAPAGERETSVRLFGKTWCLGGQPQAVTCDFTLPASPAATTDQPASAAGERTIDRFLAALRRMFGGEATTAAAPAGTSATSGG